MPNLTTTAPMSICEQLLVGLATGGLLGTLLGLSAAPVVAAFVGGVSALVMTLFSVRRDSESSLHPYLVFAFALTCIGGVALGIAARTHAWLSPSPQQTQATWASLSYTERQARDLATYEHLGLLLISDDGKDKAGEHFVKAGDPHAETALHSFNPAPRTGGDDGERTPPGCDKLMPAVYDDLESATQGLKSAGRMWADLVTLVERYVPARQQLGALKDAKDTICARAGR